LQKSHSAPYHVLLPAGAVAVEGFVTHRAWNWLKPTCLIVLVLGGVLTAPLALPVLPVETFIRYQHWLGIPPSTEERGDKLGRLSQMYADMFGWPEMAAQMAQIYNHLSLEDKTDCVIGASNYGEAGAIDFFGKDYGLPNAISTHNNYWFWGPGDKPGKVLLVIGGSKEDYEGLYEDVWQVSAFANPYAVESGKPIFLCRKPKGTLQAFWPHHHDFI